MDSERPIKIPKMIGAILANSGITTPSGFGVFSYRT
jgi:hypothetical protein